MAQDNKQFTLEDILEEQRLKREDAQASAPAGEDVDAAEENAAVGENAEAADTDVVEESGVREEKAPARQKRPAKEEAAKEEAPASPAPSQEETEPQPPKGKKKKKKGLFGRRRVPDFDETEDMYYGIQLKPIDEYRKGYDSATGEASPFGEDSFQALFDDSQKSIDDEVEENFQRLQRERRRRVAQAVQTAGVDEKEIADEFGVVAPMPVTAFAADPYARQHGIELEGEDRAQKDVPEIQKAMLETSADPTMEIKLNVMNNTVELQRIRDEAPVSQATVGRILQSAPDQGMEGEEGPSGEEELPPEPIDEGGARTREIPLEEPVPLEEMEDIPPKAPVEEAESRPEEAPKREEKAPAPRGPEDIPRLSSIYEYRSRGIPTHIVNADVLQSALLSESEDLDRARKAEEERRMSRSARRAKARQEKEASTPETETGGENFESIEDYTGPEDARSISHELKGDMRELSLRMTITGICTLALAVVNLIFGGQFAAVGDVGSGPLVYTILTLVLTGVSVGVCCRTIGNGLKALFAFNANSDSAAAVAAVAVLVQTLLSLFFRTDMVSGKLHLYAVLLSAALFLNAAGKLTMIRRIHSNFRFVSSGEQKYTVRVYDDYNTSLKMAKDRIGEKPCIAYQCKAGFLKRFLELSYAPDPSETASQTLAPIGLVSSLVLCIVTLLITRSVPTAISAFAAASCACVAAPNMLSVNLPISRLCKTARRAGAMVVGHEAVEQLGNVNAVIVDAEEIFPRGTVVLNGIKTFGSRESTEEAVMAASALMREFGGPLSGVFDQVINENEDALPQVEKYSYEDESGIVGRVNGKTVYIGNRALLINHRIEVLPREEEAQYASANQSLVYLALDTAVCAMMILTYSADRRRRNELQRMEDNGISVLVRTTDPNVTVPLISRLFGLDPNSVGILEGKLGDTANALTGQTVPRADAVAATKGRMESMLSVISSCVREKRTLGIVVAIQSAAVILGFVLVAFMACFGGMAQLSSLILFIFEAFWVILIMVLPKLRR